ncbi:MAG: hypothetical protein DRJ21_00295 [Candidatus Methanomethylicota archaeon]|uniref:CN hydrolase domain-containing protein n=1 Tax=Thermoproteota archaeon TaxID=2056631 RepID=A0A497EW32_9CREN|nr:MAG: hypothetical protein DRJ21_00295 [Candidatus Verstraetearchaeota archaeon]
MRFIAASIQMKIRSFSRDENLKNALKMADKAAECKAKLIVYPEYFLTECPSKNKSLDELKKIAEPIPDGPTIKEFCKKAKEIEAYIVVGTILEIENDKIYNTSTLVNPKGEVIGKQRKTHPENHPSKHEVGLGITPSNDLHVFDTELGKIGILIDVDANVPEIPRVYALKGAEIICWPLNWSVRWAYLVPAIASTYAYVTQCYFIASNRAGLREEQIGPYPLYYMGPSVIANPEGEIIGYASGFYQCMALAEIDKELLKKIREYNKNTYPLWRRPKVFEDVIK